MTGHLDSSQKICNIMLARQPSRCHIVFMENGVYISANRATRLIGRLIGTLAVALATAACANAGPGPQALDHWRIDGVATVTLKIRADSPYLGALRQAAAKWDGMARCVRVEVTTDEEVWTLPVTEIPAPDWCAECTAVGGPLGIGLIALDSWEYEQQVGVLTHEIGHVLGLAHNDREGTLMYPYYSSATSGALIASESRELDRIWCVAETDR